MAYPSRRSARRSPGKPSWYPGVEPMSTATKRDHTWCMVAQDRDTWHAGANSVRLPNHLCVEAIIADEASGHKYVPIRVCKAQNDKHNTDSHNHN
eukprot:365910-Chlamydomonas_euryale.AAC.7